MVPRRRKPPLLEALGTPPSSRSAARGGPGLGSSHPSVVHPASSTNGAAAPGSGARTAPSIEPRPIGTGAGASRPLLGGTGERNRSTVILFLIATLVGLFAITWSLAYRFGHRSGQRSVLIHTDPKDAAAITGQTPVELPPSRPATGGARPTAGSQPSGSGGSGTGSANGSPGSTRPMPPIVGRDPRQPGFNYLEVCLLTWRDAEPAVRFLQANGIRATAVPASKDVDPAKPEPKNRFLIIVDQPFASGKEYRNSQAERDALKAEIRRLGKRWQTEHRGASDFHEPEFRLQKGGK